MENFEKIIREKLLRESEVNSRRQFVKQCANGIGGLALGSIFMGCNPFEEQTQKVQFSERDLNPLATLAPPLNAKAKSVIYLHMAGSPSQLEMFDYKPVLEKLNNQPCPDSFIEGRKFAFIKGKPKLLGPQAKFSQEGESGNWVSDNMPHFKKVVDEVSFLKAVHTDQFNHGPAQLFMHTGSPRLGRPSIGAWTTYGLGSENQNLPGFVVLTSGGLAPSAGKSVWGSGFLPSVYQGVQCRSKGDPVLYIDDPKGISRDIKKSTINAINKINKQEYMKYGDPEILARINQYEMAYRMQIAVPNVMNIENEPENIKQMYGVEPGKESFANNCLLARKLVEDGVRFVQLFDWGWDSHGTNHQTAVDLGLRNKCKDIDRPITALILDLKQRGLLDDTLIVWGGEFGRTPMQENRGNVEMAFKGRDHHGDAFTMWMAGGGIKRGGSHGATDEIGFSGVEGRVSVHDVHATILHLLGFNHEQFTFDFQGRPFRLTDVHGHVINEILA
mgnify:CR=1 FL=1